MPSAPPSACVCGGRRTAGVCSRCGPRRPKDTRKHAAARGYDYKWQKFRKIRLYQQPLCEDCRDSGIVSAATDIHHVKKLSEYPELKYDIEWHRHLCGACHAKRTARGE